MGAPSRLVRKAVTGALLALAVTASAPAPAAAYDDEGYFAYADRMQERFDPLWDEDLGRYRPGGGGVDAMVNALLLLTHSVAARQGHDGPARNDHRARLLALALVSPPVFMRSPPSKPTSQTHIPGWSCSMNGGSCQHLVIDAEIVDGLVEAYRARDELDLPESTARAIADSIDRTVRGRYWRWPTIRLNQINWYVLMYSADATVTGRTDLVRNDLRNQVLRFVGGIRAHSGLPGNLGPGMRFHYLPFARAGHPMNVDSAEYANIVLSFSRFYDQARHAGMKPLPNSHLALLHQWAERVLAGYWTHGGYMNWDTGLGFDRWHQAKKLGLAQQALIGIAQAEALQPAREWGSWAKWTLDRGLRFYEDLPTADGGLPDPVLFKLFTVPQGLGSARLAAARMQSNATRAVSAGLGSMPSEQPPAMYSFDPDIGRLAVTTPAYNTAIVAVNQRAFPYGGIELARLFDGDQEVAAGIGGRAPAAFGLLVRDPSGRRLFSSQTGRTETRPTDTPLRLTRAPAGVGASARTETGRAFAGPFGDLRATGTLTAGRFHATTSHRFTERSIETRWSLVRLRGRARLETDVLFPSWGSEARVVAVLTDDTRVSLRAQPVALERVEHFEIESERSGYTIVPLSRPAGAVARLLVTARQSSAPDPGPTLAIDVARGASWRRATFAARLTVVPR